MRELHLLIDQAVSIRRGPRGFQDLVALGHIENRIDILRQDLMGVAPITVLNLPVPEAA
jgi:hypothetical protein